jgi:N-acetylmuramoyl-L-alanine amidase
MSKIVEWFLLPLFFILSIVYAFNSFGNSIELKRLFHHATSDDSYLERGNVSLYFSQDPRMKKIDMQSFFFPCVINSNECDTMIQRINNYQGSYSISIEKTTTPDVGIIISFHCDPKAITLSYEEFDSIRLQKGVVFHLYNKQVIDALQHRNNQQPLLRMLQHKTIKPCITIDSGHGGLDTGAIGNDNIQEKNICLAVSKNVAQLLRDGGYSVFLTREEDRDLFLDERTLFANQHHTDLFISIHANYSGNSTAKGIETFCLQPALFKERYSLLSEDQKKYVAGYIQDKISVSHKLALSIQNFLCGELYKQDNMFKKPYDRRVKFSVSQVLLGAQMPAVLVEIGFLSHKKEVQLLANENYQKFLAQRIFDGIIHFLSV